MGAPVWVLSVDLQAKTATFQSGMADAARSARGSFTEIGSGARAMGGTVGGHMFETRHSVMMLSEAFGTTLPRGITAFIASLGPLGPALEAAFPFIAVGLGALLLIEHLTKLHEAGEKLTEDQMKFGTAVQVAFNGLDQKLMEAQIKTDDLRGNHLGALAIQLKLIDAQSMAELVHQFDTVAKAADVVFTDLHGHWYDLGNDSVGAKHALDEFQAKYAALLAAGNRSGATDLLKGTRDSALTVLGTLQRAVDAGVHNTQDKLAAQHQLVDALNAQLVIEQKVAAVETADKGTAKAAANKLDNRDSGKAARELAEAEQKGVEEMGRIIHEANEKMATDIAEGERMKIDATRKGSKERLAAIEDAMLEEARLGMENSSSEQALAREHAAMLEEMQEQEKSLKRAADAETASQTEQMGMLRLAAQREHDSTMIALHRDTAAQAAQMHMNEAADETALHMTYLSTQIANLDRSDAEYLNKLKAFEDEKARVAQDGAQKIIAIQDAEAQRQASVLESAQQKMLGTMSAGLSKSIMGHESWAKMLNGFASEAAEGLIKNSIMVALQQDKERLGNARTAATSAYASGVKVGGPLAPVVGALYGAGGVRGGHGVPRRRYRPRCWPW